MNDEKNTPEITGNGFIDAYNLGYEAGKEIMKKDVANADDRRWSMMSERDDARKERDAARTEVIRLRAKNKKLKKLLKAGE